MARPKHTFTCVECGGLNYILTDTGVVKIEQILGQALYTSPSPNRDIYTMCILYLYICVIYKHGR